MFNGYLKDLIKHVPALVVQLVVIWLFLGYIKERDKHLDSISAECHLVQRESIVSMNKICEAIGAKQEVTRQISVALDKVTRQLAKIE